MRVNEIADTLGTKNHCRHLRPLQLEVLHFVRRWTTVP
jgi:hypothetical protein